ncbi:hypothetical protein C5B96_00185 [Subtercola sp. Z020]|uniref:hypothetical protein n=1 Tax=Subtercola sp. Z020 TaxID=2080582 RepID=UPI000CE7C9AA|nr:hypothetical protein [Subtercola sp. Z020]PPF90126.1 hypothetical protein C5B96_00185 [Subtercola sp. Z020]
MNVREFVLTDEHATTVSDQILDATRAGGGYVHLRPISAPEADVLITPGTTVTFERLSSVRPQITASEESWLIDGWPDEF